MAPRLVETPRSWARAWTRVSLLCAVFVISSRIQTRADEAAAVAPRGAEWVAADSVIHVEATRPAVLLDRVLGEGFQAYLKAIPAYSRYLKSPEFVQQAAHVKFIATMLDTSWDQGLRDLTGGGAILSVEAVGKAPAIVLVVTPKSPAFLAKTHAKLVEFARADASGKGRPDPIKTKDYRGITTYSVSPEEAHAIVKETLVVANGFEALTRTIDRALDAPKAGVKVDAERAARQGKARSNADTVAWGVVRLDKLRALDNKFAVPDKDKVDPGATFLFGPWIEALRKSDRLSASITWSDSKLSADIDLPMARDKYSETFARYLPPKGQGAPALLAPKGVIGNLTLWRDLSSIWEVRNDIFPPQTVQNLAQLDSFAGQFFGGRDFGSGVLASLGTNWRVVVAEQDFAKINPVPDLKLPAFALVIDLKPDDDEFAQRLRVAFQSFIGLANLGAAQTKAPPLESGSEIVDGVTILTTRYLAPKVEKAPETPGVPAKKAPIHQRHNFSPSAVQVGNTFVLSSSTGLARDLVPILKASGKPRFDVKSSNGVAQELVPTLKTRTETAVLDVNGATLARLVDANRTRLVMQNMLEKGNDKAKAETEIDVLAAIVRYLGHATLTASDADDALRFKLDFALGKY